MGRIFRTGRALQGGVRGWVTSFCTEYVGHAPAARAYERNMNIAEAALGFHGFGF